MMSYIKLLIITSCRNFFFEVHYLFPLIRYNGLLLTEEVLFF